MTLYEFIDRVSFYTQEEYDIKVILEPISDGYYVFTVFPNGNPAYSCGYRQNINEITREEIYCIINKTIKAIDRTKLLYDEAKKSI